MSRIAPWPLAFSVACPGLTAEPAPCPGAGRLRVVLVNDGGSPVRVGTVRAVAPLEADARGGRVWIHGRYMQRDALVRVLGAPAEEGYLGEYARRESWSRHYLSRGVMVLGLPSPRAPALLAGALRQDRFFVDVELALDADEARALSVSLIYELEGTEVPAGGRLDLPEVMLLQGTDPQELIERYADEVGRGMAARVPGRVPTGWCSWYFFYDRVRESDVLANLDAMAASRHPAGGPDYVQIDDGFQSCTGDWLAPNDKFPSGMASLARRIREAGYRPGLWLAPLVMHERSAVLRERPDLALRRHSGEVHLVETWLGRCAVLDCTHPDAEAWLGRVIRTVVRDWGYALLKLDALAFAACPADEVRYHRAGTTAPANLRHGLEIIRAAAGDDVFLLGCTCHFGPAVGLVDAMRVGPDVKEVWANGPRPSVRHAMRITLQRNWMHGRLWVNDPDCLIAREAGSALTEDEVRFLATGIALSGGMVVLGDDLPALGEARRRIPLALVPPTGVAARPVDPGEGPVPTAWRVALGPGRSLVGLLNWGEEPRQVDVTSLLGPGELAFDVWNGRMVSSHTVEVRPHEGVLWQVTGPGDGPRVVGDTGHVAFDGLVAQSDGSRLLVRNERGHGRVVAVEAPGRVVVVELAPGETREFG